MRRRHLRRRVVTLAPLLQAQFRLIEIDRLIRFLCHGRHCPSPSWKMQPTRLRTVLINLHIILPRDQRYQLLYILGLINSKLMDVAYAVMNPEKGEALAEIKKHQARTGSARLAPSQPAGPVDRRRLIRHSSFNNVERLAVIVSVRKVMAWTWSRPTTVRLVRSGTQQMVSYLFKEGCDADIVDRDCHRASHRLGCHHCPGTTGIGRAKSEEPEGRAAIRSAFDSERRAPLIP